MKKLLIIVASFILIGCFSEPKLNCKCEFINYTRENLEDPWIEINKITRLTNCDSVSFFVISHGKYAKDLISCN